MEASPSSGLGLGGLGGLGLGGLGLAGALAGRPGGCDRDHRDHIARPGPLCSALQDFAATWLPGATCSFAEGLSKLADRLSRERVGA